MAYIWRRRRRRLLCSSKNSINKYYNPKGKFGACFMSTSCKLYKSILFQLLLQLKLKKKEATISEKRVSFALSGPPEGYSVNSIKEDAL